MASSVAQLLVIDFGFTSHGRDFGDSDNGQQWSSGTTVSSSDGRVFRSTQVGLDQPTAAAEAFDGEQARTRPNASDADTDVVSPRAHGW
jgi:hypothetical protein